MVAQIELDLAHSYHANPQQDADYALLPLQMTFKAGGAYALLGPSGCGKTTMLNIISGLVKPSQGRVTFNGEEVTGLTPQQRNIAQVFQFPVIYDTMTVAENLAFPLQNRQMPREQIKQRVGQIAEMLELNGQLNQRAAGLSADTKQKISLARGGATNSPAAVYAATKYVDCMKKYSPKEAIGMTFGEAGHVPAQGQIAQQIFWYTAFTVDMTKPGLPVVNADGTPKWCMAPGPNGPYWKKGMQNGYQDVGSWTFFKDHDPDRTAAAWLYAQFVTAKTTSLKKTIVGLTPIRESDIRSDAMTKMAPKLGGLVEFYRSPARVAWTPTGTNVPDYSKLAQLWWKNVAVAVTGEKTPQQAMDNLASEMDDVMARLERAGMARCAPKLNLKGDPAKYLSNKAAPWAK